MSSFFTENFLNFTIVEVAQVIWHSISAGLGETTVLIQNKSLVTAFESLPEYLYFNEFQFTLLKTLTVILLINLILTFVAWKYYGRRICERFMKPATSRAIEELKASVARLKLPKEHTPRI